MDDWLEAVRRKAREEGAGPNPPAGREQIAQAEAAIGFPLPEAMRRLYAEIGNGGFGPGQGLLPLIGEPLETTVAGIVNADRESDQDGPFENYLPLFRWDDNGIGYAYVGTGDAHVILADDDYAQDAFDRNRPIGEQYPIVADSIEALMRDWADGKPLRAEQYGLSSG